MTTKMPYGWGKVPFDLDDRKKWMDLPFSAEEYAARIERVRDKMRGRGYDALVVYGTRGDRGPTISGKFWTLWSAYYDQ